MYKWSCVGRGITFSFSSFCIEDLMQIIIWYANMFWLVSSNEAVTQVMSVLDDAK